MGGTKPISANEAEAKLQFEAAVTSHSYPLTPGLPAPYSPTHLCHLFDFLFPIPLSSDAPISSVPLTFLFFTFISPHFLLH